MLTLSAATTLYSVLGSIQTTLVRLKTFFFLKPFPLVMLRLISWNLTTRCLTVTGGDSVGECGRLSQLSWLLGAVYLVVYLLSLLSLAGRNMSSFAYSYSELRDKC